MAPVNAAKPPLLCGECPVGRHALYDPTRYAMTADELSRWRVAQQLLEAHEDGAVGECGRRAAKFVRLGDFEGFYLWQNIALKIHMLQYGVGHQNAGQYKLH